MINKIEIITEKISNIQFHIDHVNNVMANPGLYPIPDNKNEVDLVQYLQDLMLQKEALELEKQALTNQGYML
jgi:D-ribose pyranose/furanose isomerase RbsD